jgi:hypothetical protein
VLRFTLEDTIGYVVLPQEEDNPLRTYLSEGANPAWQAKVVDAGGTTPDELDFVFIDRHSLPDFALSGHNGVARSGFNFKFHTDLVGVSGSVVVPFQQPGHDIRLEEQQRLCRHAR